MIISASRRTDIPAFYAKWFINRVRAGYCAVPNPFNRTQVTRVSLTPADVDVIVFWTRHPRPLLPYLAELDARGYRYYFQYTLMDNPRRLEPKTPPLATALKNFRELARRIGADKVIWRYDPIVFSAQTGAQFHQQRYEYIARELNGYTRRSVISIVDVYRKAHKRLREMAEQGLEVVTYEGNPSARLAELLHALVGIAAANDMEIGSCAEDIDLRPYGIKPGKCVDDEYIARIFDIKVTDKKDAGQRAACGCVVSRDIGMYDSCLFECQYCYATSSFARAKINHAQHDPASPSLIGRYDAPEPSIPQQTSLFD